VCKEK
jgi:hypothetical protein